MTKEALDKPRIRLDPTRPGWGKWECFSRPMPWHLKHGKGYSPTQAYRRWRSCS